MLNKTFCNIAQVENLPKNQAICVQVSTETELLEALKLLETRESLTGVQVSSNLLFQFLQSNNCNFVSIILNETEDLDLILKHLKPKQQFIELIIPYSLISEKLLVSLQGVKRIIIDFSNENKDQITKKQIQTLFASLISNKYYPFTKGLNQEQVPIQHMLEFYQGTIATEQVQDSQNHKASIKEFLENKNEGDLL